MRLVPADPLEQAPITRASATIGNRESRALGNLHEQRGDLGKAAEIWKRGLSFFPDDADLNGKIR